VAGAVDTLLRVVQPFSQRGAQAARVEEAALLFLSLGGCLQPARAQGGERAGQLLQLAAQRAQVAPLVLRFGGELGGA